MFPQEVVSGAQSLNGAAGGYIASDDDAGKAAALSPRSLRRPGSVLVGLRLQEFHLHRFWVTNFCRFGGFIFVHFWLSYSSILGFNILVGKIKNHTKS